MASGVGSMRPLTMAIAAAYLTGAFLTFGYGANRQCALGVVCEHLGDSIALPMAPAWPIYWLARGAVEVTKP